jgi:YbbR domain-containing protein
MKQTAWGLSENSSYKIVALLITLILWVIILGSKEATTIKMVHADYLLPKDMVIINGPSVPQDVAFRVSGPRLALKKFTESNEPLTVDLTSALEGLTTVRIHPDSINVPPGLRVTSVSPSTITPKLERIVGKVVVVEPQMAGPVPPGTEVKLIVDPPQWEVFGARSVVERMKSVKTLPIQLEKLEDTVKEVPLSLDEPGLARNKDAVVKVEIKIEQSKEPEKK